ncbi:MAG: putative ABC transporter ATP-binding protein YlmA [Gammaproteobacteria bacterium]|nr:putative ABC transporter ATP-binding protein YlmA [Gammaproteobacteria bacterium]
MNLIDIQNATVYRGDTCVFDNLTLSIGQSGNTAVIGPNGAGKTTLLKVLNRELYPVRRPDSHVRILGRERWDVWEFRKSLGLVSHDLHTHYLGYVRGIEVVLSGYYASVGVYDYQSFGDSQIERARKLVDWLGVGDIAERLFSTMSTGQQRRFLLGRALIHQPRYLVLDEPTGGLDLKATFQYLDVIRRLMQEGRTILLVTHHIHEIPPEIDRVILMSGGHIVGDGPKHDMLSDDRLSHLFDVPIHVVSANGYYQTLPG